MFLPALSLPRLVFRGLYPGLQKEKGFKSGSVQSKRKLNSMLEMRICFLWQPYSYPNNGTNERESAWHEEEENKKK